MIRVKFTISQMIDRKDVWAEFAQGRIGMMLGSPAVIPIIQAAGVLKSSVYATANVPGKTGPLTSTLGVHDDIVAFNTGGHRAAIRKFLDFAYQDSYQLQFDHEYDLLPATRSAAATMAKNPMFAAFLILIAVVVLWPIVALVQTSMRNITPIGVTIGSAARPGGAATGRSRCHCSGPAAARPGWRMFDALYPQYVRRDGEGHPATLRTRW